MTNYLEMMQDTAGPTAGPLKKQVETADAALAAVQERITATAQDVQRKEAALERHRESSTEKLASSTSAFSEWQGRLRRIERELGSAREALALLRSEVEPRAVADRDEARKALRKTLVAACHRARAEAERLMSQALADAVSEHDAYLDARAALFREYGVSTSRDEPPVARNARLGGAKIRKPVTGPASLVLAPPKP